MVAAAKISELKGPMGYLRKLAILAKAPVAKREISNVQLTTATLPILLGMMGLPTLLCSNYLRDVNAQPINNPFIKSLVNWAGKSFQVIFELLTLNQIAINVQLAAPGRLITYVLLALANPYFGQFEWKSIDLTNELRDINSGIKSVKRQLSLLYRTTPDDPQIAGLESRLDKLQAKQKQIFNKLEECKAKTNFFVRVLMNFIMAFSFASFGPHISSSTQFGELYPKPGEKYKETMGPFKGQLPQGYTWKDFWNGHKGNTEVETTPPYLELLKRNAVKELKCFKQGFIEFFNDMADPAKSQKTFTGGNAHVEADVTEANKNETNRFIRTCNRWRIRASGGLAPLVLNNFNMMLRLGLFAASLGAISQGGMKVFNQQPVLNDKTLFDPDVYNNDEQKELNWFGQLCNNVSDSGIFWARLISGVSGVLIAFNPAYLKTTGVAAQATYALGAALTSGSAFTGGMPQMKILDISMQLLGTTTLGMATGLANVNKELAKPAAQKIIKEGLESRRAKYI
jgi:hypothetical protein